MAGDMNDVGLLTQFGDEPSAREYRAAHTAGSTGEDGADAFHLFANERERPQRAAAGIIGKERHPAGLLPG
jgi:hypothetical protein